MTKRATKKSTPKRAAKRKQQNGGGLDEGVVLVLLQQIQNSLDDIELAIDDLRSDVQALQ